MNDLGWTVLAGAARREELSYPADWFNSYSCSLDDNVYILVGLIISQDVIQEYLSRNHKGNCNRQKLQDQNIVTWHPVTNQRSVYCVLRGPGHAFNRTGRFQCERFENRTYPRVWTNWVCFTATRTRMLTGGPILGQRRVYFIFLIPQNVHERFRVNGFRWRRSEGTVVVPSWLI